MTSLHLISKVQVKLFVLMKSRFLDNSFIEMSPSALIRRRALLFLS
jgi:hypothetical protein